MDLGQEKNLRAHRRKEKRHRRNRRKIRFEKHLIDPEVGNHWGIAKEEGKEKAGLPATRKRGGVGERVWQPAQPLCRGKGTLDHVSEERFR